MVMVQYKFVCTQLRNCSNHAEKFDCYKVPFKLGNATAPNDPTRCDRIATPLTGIQPQLPPQFPSIPMQIARAPPLASKDCHKASLVEEFEEQYEVDPPTTSDATDVPSAMHPSAPSFRQGSSHAATFYRLRCGLLHVLQP